MSFWGTPNNPGRVFTVALGAGTSNPSLISTLTLNSGEGPFYAAAVGATEGGTTYVYFGAFSSPGLVVKLAYVAPTAAPTKGTYMHLFSL